MTRDRVNVIGRRDVADLAVVAFPRLSQRARRAIAALRAARYRRTPHENDRSGPAFRSWVRVNPTLLTLTHFASDPSVRERARRMRVDGLEHLESALERGKGAIIWEVPFGDQTLSKLALVARGFAMVQVHGVRHGGSKTWFGQHVIRRIHRRIEARFFEEIIDIDDRSFVYLRRVVDRLRSNKIVCIPALGPAGNKFVAVRFRGESRYFPTGVLTLARQTGATLIPLFSFPDGGEHRLVLGNPLPLRSADRGDRGLARLAALYVAELESWVDKYPSQWGGWGGDPVHPDRLTILAADGAELRSP